MWGSAGRAAPGVDYFRHAGGGGAFGFVVVLLAIPVTAVIGVLIRFGIHTYLGSNYYQGDTSLVKIQEP